MTYLFDPSNAVYSQLLHLHPDPIAYNNCRPQVMLGKFHQSTMMMPNSDIQLYEIEKELKSKIDKARMIAATCRSDEALDHPIEEASNLENLQLPHFDSDINYNEEFWKVYLSNEIHLTKIGEATQKTALLNELLTQIQELQSEYYRINKLKNRKKNRRLALEIEKSFTCPYVKCHRIYGSDVSLNLHIKLKHNGGNKTDREKLAELICAAEQKVQPPPEMTLDLPPGYLNQYRKLYFQKEDGEPENPKAEEQ